MRSRDLSTSDCLVCVLCGALTDRHGAKDQPQYRRSNIGEILSIGRKAQ